MIAKIKNLILHGEIRDCVENKGVHYSMSFSKKYIDSIEETLKGIIKENQKNNKNVKIERLGDEFIVEKFIESNEIDFKEFSKKLKIKYKKRYDILKERVGKVVVRNSIESELRDLERKMGELDRKSLDLKNEYFYQKAGTIYQDFTIRYGYIFVCGREIMSERLEENSFFKDVVLKDKEDFISRISIGGLMIFIHFGKKKILDELKKDIKEDIEKNGKNSHYIKRNRYGRKVKGIKIKTNIDQKEMALSRLKNKELYENDMKKIQYENLSEADRIMIEKFNREYVITSTGNIKKRKTNFGGKKKSDSKTYIIS